MKKKLWLAIGCLCLAGAAATAGIYLNNRVRVNEQQEVYENLLAENNAEKAEYTAPSEGEEKTEEAEMKAAEAASNNTEGIVAVSEETETLPSNAGENTLPDTAKKLQTTAADKAELEKKYQALEEKYGVEIPRKNIDFSDLWENTNADIYAWIYIPGTKIDYPILQHPTDDYYYLNHNMDHSKGYPGCIYTEYKNDKDFSDSHTVLYGHNMKNGTMFAGLHQYEDSQFFTENPYFYVYTENDVFVYKIFRAYKYTNAHLLLNFDTKTESGMERYLQEIKSFKSLSSNADEELLNALTTQDKICSLSTCVKNDSNSRYLVQGVLCDVE